MAFSFNNFLPLKELRIYLPLALIYSHSSAIDIKHPGRTNEFLIKTDDDLAILYSDSSILERMHISELFLICNGKGATLGKLFFYINFFNPHP